MGFPLGSLDTCTHMTRNMHPMSRQSVITSQQDLVDHLPKPWYCDLRDPARPCDMEHSITSSHAPALFDNHTHVARRTCVHLTSVCVVLHVACRVLAGSVLAVYMTSVCERCASVLFGALSHLCSKPRKHSHGAFSVCDASTWLGLAALLTVPLFSR